MPEVSVVIPTRNRWPILSKAALPAALMQEEVDIEIIVVDDGSTDGTRDGLVKLGQARVTVLRHEVGRGVSAARNTGIDAARGEWVAFLDDDDIWAPRKIRAQVDHARQRRAGFAFSSAVTVDPALRPAAYRSPPDVADLGELLLRGNVVPSGCSNVVAQTELVRRLGGFDERLSMIADWDLWLRLAQEASAAACAEVHVGYVEHGRNMAVTTPRDVVRESKYFAEKHKTLGSRGNAVDRLASVRWVAWSNFWAGERHLAARLLLAAGVTEASMRDVWLGLRFLVWATAPEWFSQALWRLRHVRDGNARPSPPAPPPPAWLSLYQGLSTAVGEELEA